jgi:hypothetical protein
MTLNNMQNKVMTRRKHSLLVARNDSSFSLQTVPMLMIYFSMFGQ